MTEKEKRMKDLLMQRYGQQCWGCDVAITEKQQLELDHIQAAAFGGSDTIENRILLCGPCNRQKGVRLSIEGLRLELKAGIGGRGVGPSTFDYPRALKTNKLKHENDVRTEPTQGVLSLDTVIKESEENPSLPVHPDSEVSNVIGMLWYQGLPGLAEAFLDVVKFVPLSDDWNRDEVRIQRCKIVFMSGAAASVIACKQVRGAGKVNLTILEAVATAKGLCVERSYYERETYEFDYCGLIHEVFNPVPGVDDVDDLPF